MNLTDAVALSSIITTPAHLCLLCLRFGQKSCPYLCQVCADKAREAQSKAAVLLDTELGKYILHSAQAFYKRDYQRISNFFAGVQGAGVSDLPVDSEGRLHPHLHLQSTCCWEPFIGKVAENARSEAMKVAGFFKQATVALHWYTYKGHLAQSLVSVPMAGHVVQANQSPEVVLASLVQECPSASSTPANPRREL